MKDFVIFVGPSLPRSEEWRDSQFDWRPPAAQGDVFQAVREGARAIGLIDGYFEGVPAVLHKEILFALHSGVHVLGAASIGALRAAELEAYGMRGVGAIFNWYASNMLDADDEVAVVHAPAELGHFPLSVPLVNVRATIDEAVRTKSFSAGCGRALFAAARSLHFKQRTWPLIAEVAERKRPGGVPSATWLTKRAVDQKQIDARSLVKAMSDLAQAWPGPSRPNFVFESTDAWDACVVSLDEPGKLAEQDRRVVDEARLLGEQFEELMAAASATVLAAGVGTLAARAASPAEIHAFRRGRGLCKTERFLEWLRENGLDAVSLSAALGARSWRTTLVDTDLAALLGATVAEIKLRGLYPSLVERAARKAATLADDEMAAAFAPGTRRMLLEWFCGHHAPGYDPDDPERLRRALALPDLAALLDMARREYMFAGQESRA